MPDFGNRRAIEELDKLLTAGVPDQGPRDLLVLVKLASTVTEQSVVPVPEPTFKARLRADLLRLEPVARTTPATRLREASDPFVRRARLSMRAIVATATAASLLGTVGVAAAAESAIPGDALYSVKEFVESTRLALADSGVEDGRLQLLFAAERLDELEGGLSRLSSDQMVALLGRMDDQSIAGAEDLLTAAASASSSSLLVLVADFTTSQAVRLADLRDDLPATAAPFADLSLETLRRIQLQVDAIAESTCDCGVTAMPAAAVAGPIDAIARPAVAVPQIVITRPGDGPAAPARPCACGSITAAPPREPAPVAEPEPAPSGAEPSPEPSPQPSGDPSPSPEPSEPSPAPSETESDDDGVITVLPSPVGEIVSEVDGIVGEVLPDEIEGPVDDIVQDIDDALDPVEDLVNEIISDLPLP